MKDYDQYDALGLAQLVRDRQVSPEELLEAAIARVERTNPAVNAVVTRLYDHARNALRQGIPDGPFKGVPFLLKDLNALYKGAVTSNGCRFFATNQADHDTEVVARYKRGGLCIFGKTNTPEFGLTVTTEPRLFGATRNPWDLGTMAGGSSGGAAAAVAAGMLPAAHATDGGGSIRIPASCCGLFGLKPTRGRNPAGPDRGEGWSGMSTEHVITRSVRDSAALLDLTAGPDTGAPYFAPQPSRSFLTEAGLAPGALRIALVTRTPEGKPVHAECERAARDAGSLMAALGHHVEEAELGGLPEEFGPAFRIVIGGNIRTVVELYANKIGRQPTPEEFEKITWMFFESGAKASAADYARAVLAIHRTGRQVARWFDNYDIVLSPTLADLPAKIGVLDMNTDDPEGYGRHVAQYTAFTAPYNASGNPAATVPLHWAGNGLPVGVQLGGRYGDEATLLRVSAQLEQARPWFNRRPVLMVNP
jgi:Asp-tRNA(Asn)/Glu-tRNA(Gln) amidotransferase A subunit family amidase